MDAPPSHLSGRRPVLIADQPSIARSASDFVSPTSLSVSQSLASILNNPHSNDASWSIWWPSATITPEFAPISPPLSEVTFADFHLYLQSISNTYSRFEDILQHSTKETALDVGVSRGQGEALVACLREVPSLFFKEDFALEDGGTFKAACPFSPSESENFELQERLTQYLDVVEMHLVREIALRSDSFFEAQGQLEGLNGEIVAACVRIRELKEAIRILTVDLVGSAREVQEFSATRRSLVALQQKLTVILYVSEALSALKLLVAAGDCAGALDVIDDLQHLLDTDELVGLHCFRHLRDQLAVSLDSINSILSAEFLLAAIHDARAVESAILLNVKMRASGLTNGLEDAVELDDDESCSLRDRLLPLIIGLLRTAKLPAVLRIYRDTLIAEMKAAIKTTVAELLPILLTRPSESDLVAGENTVDSEGGGSSLASKLRSLSCESFVQLLIAIFKVVQAHLIRAAGVKQVIEWIMGNLVGYYVADAVSSAVPHGGAAYVAADAQESNSLVALHVQYSTPRNTSKVPLIQRKANDGSSPNTSKNFRADVLRENTEAVFAACDAAHGRWAKLLGVRALLHPRLRRQEFLSIYNITQEFIAATEKIGGRLGYSIRGTLQSQSKAFVDFQHESRMTKIKAVLDQETWAAVDVPDEFQTIVASLSATEASWNSSELGSGNGISPVVDYEAQAEATPILNEDDSKHQHGRATSETLKYGGDGYHMVNCGLILLKMLSEYVDISACLPALSSEVVQRVVELLKLFNTRTCQLVLGAGAMQVSGLKSITSKHLALASQIISFIYVIIPELRQVLFLKIPEARKGLLSSEIDRVAQDFRLHRDEIHTKLVQIMRERLFANLRKLPQIVESWNRPEDNDLQPSQFARAVTKEVTFLHRILSQTLLENDVQAIFRQVTQIFHSHITEAFSKLDVSTPQANNRLSRDVQHVLGCIRKLPSDNIGIDGVPNFGLLDEFLAERFSAKVG